MEMQIPIPSLEDGSPDWSIVSRAWWDAVELIQRSEEKGVFAVDMALELRVMGGSDVLMAPQFGNKHGTLSIEPVSTRIVHKEVWEDFKEELAKVWMSYRDFDGSLLLSRVHWAKESPRVVTIDEVGADLFSILFLLHLQVKYDTVEYWHKIYADNMEKFFVIFNSLTEGVSIGKQSLDENEITTKILKVTSTDSSATITLILFSNQNGGGSIPLFENASLCFC